ncbi:MAG: NYN domain-containing protein [Lachnospiraceae bacterium]
MITSGAHLRGLDKHPAFRVEGAVTTNSITPVQQFQLHDRKNATDSAMIIDAMDIPQANDVNGFCIVSSDSAILPGLIAELA